MKYCRLARGSLAAALLPVLLSLFSCRSMGGDYISKTASSLLTTTQTYVSDEERITAQTDLFLTDIANKGLFSGSVLVGKNGKALLCNGWGFASSELRTLNTGDTQYCIASITKQFTAAAILLLEKQGKLKVQDRLSKYIPDCPEGWKKVTLFQLLTHTSGIHDIMNTVGYPELKKRATTPDGLVALMRVLPMDFRPGTRFSYSSSGYMLLGKVVEVVSGQPYGTFLADTIFKPLNMANSGYPGNAEFVDNQATGYRSTGEAADPVAMSFLYSAGGLVSTAKDLFLWDQALYSESVFPTEMIAEMMSPRVKIGLASYGFGWIVGRQFGRTLIFHGGGIDGFSSVIDRYVNDRTTIIVLSNVESGNNGYIKAALARIIFNR